MDYDRSRETVSRLIASFGNGGEATFTRLTGSAFDVDSGDETFTPASYSVLVVVPPETDRSRELRRIQGYDVEFYLKDGFEPIPGDVVVLPNRAGSFVVIAPVEVIAPDGEAIMYTVRARKGV